MNCFDAALDAKVLKVALVRVPEGMEERVLLALRRHIRRSRIRWLALAAAVVVVLVVAMRWPREPAAVVAVGPRHPAVAAIAEVLDSARRPAAPAASPARAALTHAMQGQAVYMGPCHAAGAAPCDHIVLRTGGETANVMLLPDYPGATRVMVRDRGMVALLGPSGDGAYIVVAASAAAARRFEKRLFDR